MPRRVAPLSVKKLASVRPGEKPIELVDGYVPGLRVRVLPSGTRTWSLNIRDSKGVRRRFEVGSGLSLAEARRKAEWLFSALATDLPVICSVDVGVGSFSPIQRPSEPLAMHQVRSQLSLPA